MNYNRYTKHQFLSPFFVRGECEAEAERNNPMGQTFLKALFNNPTGRFLEFQPMIDSAHFGSYMTAKNAILKVADRQLDKNKEISFTCAEIDALFEFVPELSKFYQRMMM